MNPEYFRALQFVVNTGWSSDVISPLLATVVEKDCATFQCRDLGVSWVKQSTHCRFPRVTYCLLVFPEFPLYLNSSTESPPEGMWWRTGHAESDTKWISVHIVFSKTWEYFTQVWEYALYWVQIKLFQWCSLSNLVGNHQSSSSVLEVELSVQFAASSQQPVSIWVSTFLRCLFPARAACPHPGYALTGLHMLADLVVSSG